jgi:hypothetical protein
MEAASPTVCAAAYYDEWQVRSAEMIEDGFLTVVQSHHRCSHIPITHASTPASENWIGEHGHLTYLALHLVLKKGGLVFTL